MKSCVFFLAFLFSLGFTWCQSVAPSISEPPKPVEGSWNITDKNITCIRADLEIRFKITVGNETKYIVLPPTAESSKSSCNATNQTQVLSLHSSKELDLAFYFEKNAETTVVKNITLTLWSLEEQPEYFFNDSKLISVQNGHSYLCKSLTSVSMEAVTMEIFEMQLQAFGSNEQGFGAAERCIADDTISDIVPIVVACALAALIIIVLIAYLIGRRRSRQKGYNSV